ncbi:MAG TPA: type IV pilin N-terminal domain-containing protein [Methanocorpusculum sp.]|nr:type IV pilin N-terminal domain-containing protein [Methanocorpusculum sp.]HJK80271.1 type IV pilin N-terminal domain-containing protein [Methanocorpusculum sp.]
MQRRTNTTRKNDAVSPVVGVMLMLVVTIIIAAVVSMYAGGLMTNQQAAPSLTMDITIKNSGYYGSSSFLAKVMSVSEPIATKDLKITTSWTANNYTSGKLNGVITGGASVTAAGNVYGWNVGMKNQDPYNMTAPWGYGNGVQNANSGKPNAYSQQFGNYTLVGGVNMYAYPAGQSGGFGGTANISANGGYGIGVSGDTSGQYYYTDWDYKAGSQVDGMQAVLGPGWENLRAGDVVTVRFTYVPTGAVIYESNVVVS